MSVPSAVNAGLTSEKGREMFSFLPQYYETSRVMQADMHSKGTEMDSLYQALDETLDQFFVRTATWGLGYWEQELGIETDRLKPVEQRRAVVESKLRGAGKFSGRLVANVAEAYVGGKVDVSFQPEAWSFTVSFVDTMGIPPNIDDLKWAIDDLKPAHMAVEYEYHHLIWNDLDKKQITWDELDAASLTWNELEVWA
ncbi:phage portal protein [Paenibacillus sp. Root52]|uniref:putative phage tail protein n=1 Tax=Paenibacillus sp. Root52 TaxID=1736552 RepID=UPI00070101A8|nr:putative phage tail protein [Paenibacillus sp. Root52]KQY91630.1 phage portal protein [Paenibacillus sp. Root52]